MNKIQRVSLFFRILLQIAFICMPILLALSWLQAPEPISLLHGIMQNDVIPHSYRHTEIRLHGIMHALTSKEKLLGFAISIIPLSVNLFIVYSLIKLFRLYEKGEIFNLKNVHCLRNTGYGLLLGQLISPFYQFAMGVVLTLRNPPGSRYASITLDQTNIDVLLVALFVILISWIMAEGCKLHEEQKLTV